MAPPAPPYDPECEVVLKAFPKIPPFTDEVVVAVRKGFAGLASPEVTYLTDPDIVHEEKSISGPRGPIELSILKARNSAGGERPAFVYMHGGGMILGTKLLGIRDLFPWIKELDAVVVSVEYRLAPEHPDPAPIEDCMYFSLQFRGLFVRTNIGGLASSFVIEKDIRIVSLLANSPSTN